MTTAKFSQQPNKAQQIARETDPNAPCTKPSTGDCAGPNQTASDPEIQTNTQPQNQPGPNTARIFKDPTPLFDHGDGNYETPLHLLTERITPIPYFFVRNNSSSVALDDATWRLHITGNGISRPLQLTYRDILALPARTIEAYLECAGNQRAMFDLLQNRPIPDNTPWMTGGVGNATWTGIPLRDLLNLAGIKANAVDVLLIGLDHDAPEDGFRRAMPIAKALDPDTLLAYAMNGEILLPDHGFPLRAIVPGWVGSNSIKWLDRIEVATQPLWTRNNTTNYVLIGPQYPPTDAALGQVITTLTLKSILALPWPATLARGPQQLRGFAYSPDAAITRVEWSDNGGATWQPATLLDTPHQYAWVRFAIAWTATPGAHTLLTRATDAASNTQPTEMEFNEKGYLFNQQLPHPITVL